MDLNKILTWLTNNKTIKLALLTGSRGANKDVDDLSDYDIALFGHHFEFLNNDNWLNGIAPYLLCIHDSFLFEEHTIPTRLVLFDTSFKVDFSFHPISIISTIIDKKILPDSFNIGYKVLADPDNIAKDLPLASYKGFNVIPPAEEEFQMNYNEFWFEIYHAAKYLKREDLWTAQSRHWAAKQQLLIMLKWDNAIKQNWKFSPKNEGRNIDKWLDKEFKGELKSLFWKLDKPEGFESLSATIHLYQRIVHNVSIALNYSYKSFIDSSVTAFIKQLRINR